MDSGLISLPTDGAHTPFKVLNTSWAAISSHMLGLLSSGARYAAGRLYYGHDVLIKRFVEAVRTGSEPPVTLDEAVRTQELVDRILRTSADH